VNNPEFLTCDEVIEIHLDQIERYGGADGLRDRALLESAVASPTASFGGAYLNSDLFEMAASLLVSLVGNHPFVDGNKRTGTTSALVFLQMNGIQIRNAEPVFSDLVIGVASGTTTKAQVADYLREHAEPSIRK
jgi:death-on-curing protein